MRVMCSMMSINLYFRYSVQSCRGVGALKIPPPPNSFLTKVSLFSIVSNWYPCNSTTTFATASDMRDRKNDHGCWFPGEHWKLGIRNHFYLQCCLWNDPCSQKVRIFVFNYVRAFSKSSILIKNRQLENCFTSHLFSALFCIMM